LCLRCASVYAGAALGILFETVCRILGARTGKASILLANTGVAAMAIVGLGGLYGLTSADSLKVFVALYFGSSLTFFAVSSIAHELALNSRRGEQFVPRLALLGLLMLWAAKIATQQGWAMPLLGALATVGIPATFLVVNLAFGLVLLRKVVDRRWRLALAIPLAAILMACEFAFLALWRHLWRIT
jgi:hypothetical protein